MLRCNISTPSDLAVELAERAKSLCCLTLHKLRDEQKQNGGKRPVLELYKTFDQALSRQSEEEFADAYAQTLTYGLLASRWLSRGVQKRFTSQGASALLPTTSPFFTEFFSRLLELRIAPELEWLIDDIANLLDCTAVEDVFGRDPVIHFYEDFLKAYDATLRQRQGVYYTPGPVVSFIVNSVHRRLIDDFGIEDGLASVDTWSEVAAKNPGITVPFDVDPSTPFVQVLDPAVGTGTFLVEVVAVIYETLRKKWHVAGCDEHTIADQWQEYVTRHLLKRLCGFEIMMAPYAIAHMKLDIALCQSGYRYKNDERINIFLTNALETPTTPADGFDFSIQSLAVETEQANKVRASKYFTVIIGNPPYSLLSQNMTPYQRKIVNPYRFIEGKPIKERGALQFEKILQDDYVKFFRVAESQIKRSQCGVIGLIANHGFIENPTLRGMRWSLLETFNNILCLDLHGNAAKKEKTPDGSPDENIFDIRQGVAIFIGSRSPKALSLRRCAHLWGSRSKKQDCLLTDADELMAKVEPFHPRKPLFEFRVNDQELQDEYEAGWSINEVFKQGSMGVVTARDRISISFDKQPLIDIATEFRDSPLGDLAVCGFLDIPRKKGWNVKRARALLQQEKELDSFVRDIDYRPFDRRKIFYHPSLVWGMSWPTMQNMSGRGNIGLSTNKRVESGDFCHALCSRQIVGHHFVSIKEVNYFFPLYINPNEIAPDFKVERNTANLNEEFLNSIRLQAGDLGPQELFEKHVFGYIYATLYSPAYRKRYRNPLKFGFPRVFLPKSPVIFRELAELGSKLVAIHLLESSEVRKKAPNYFGRNSEVNHANFSDNTIWLDRKKTSGFRSVTQEVWDFRIGGYQVARKWLKDRQAKGGKRPLPARVLSEDEKLHYRMLLRALSLTLEIMKAIDDCVERHGGFPAAFVTAGRLGDVWNGT